MCHSAPREERAATVVIGTQPPTHTRAAGAGPPGQGEATVATLPPQGIMGSGGWFWGLRALWIAGMLLQPGAGLQVPGTQGKGSVTVYLHCQHLSSVLGKHHRVVIKVQAAQ